MAWLTLAPLARGWRIATFGGLAVALGMAIVVARISNAASYLTDAPETCMNCHVMTDAYASWQRGSHGHVAVCIDCHVPHSNPVAKNAFKAQDGLRHSWVYLTRQEPQVFRLSKGAVPVVQGNCLRCHADQIAMVRLAASSERPCWDCHSNIHGEARSLSASSQTLRPQLPATGLPWMKR